MRTLNDRPTSPVSPAAHAFPARQWLVGVVLLLLISRFAAAQQKVHPVEIRRAPIAFVPNRGQATQTDRFTAKAGSYTVALGSSGATIRLTPDRHVTAADAVSLTLLGANPNPALAGQNLLRQRNSFFPTGDPKSWITDVPSYGRVEYSAVYKGIDLAFYGNKSHLEYDFAVAPGGDTRQIELALDGSIKAHINESGDLLMGTGGGHSLRLLKPIAYQVSVDGKHREPVSATYRLQAGSRATLKFEIGAYDHGRPLVIDPVLVYGELVGLGNLNDIDAATTDAQGNLYIATGISVEKLDNTGSVLFVANFGAADAHGITVDTGGNIYIAGRAGQGLPATSNAYQQTTPAPNVDSPFLAVVNAKGDSLTYCSYLSGSVDDDRALGVAVDNEGHVYIAGVTDSPDFPTTNGAYQTGELEIAPESAFLAKFDISKSGNASLVYSTRLGGAHESDGGNAVVAVDTAGNAYVAVEGNQYYPATPGAFRYAGSGNADNSVYLTKLNPAGSALIYSAFLGPGMPSSIALDGSGSVYVTGLVGIPDFPTTAGAYQTTYGAGFLSKLSPDGSRLVYSTRLGGASGPNAGIYDFAPTSVSLPPGCAANCPALVGGTTLQTNLPLVGPVQASGPATGNYNAFLIQINGSGNSASFSSYFGGPNSQVFPGNPGAEGVDGSTPSTGLDKAGNVYVALNLHGVDELLTQPAPPNPPSGYVAELATPAGLAVVSPASINFADTAVGTSNTDDANVTLQNTGGGTLHLFPPFQFSSPDFTEVDNCPAALNSGESCVLTLSFTPFAAGQDTGTLSILSDAVDSPTVVQLSGRGIEQAPLAPIFSLSNTTAYFSPYFSAQTLVIADLAPLAVIHYTTDGTTPTSASPIYSDPFTLTGTTTVKAIAIDTGVTSPVTTATYTIYSSYPLIFRSNGFGPDDLVLNGATIDQSYHLQLTDGGVNEGRSAWFPTPMPVSAFTTDFTFQLLNAAADGFTFTLQSVGPKAVGKTGGGLGYQGIGKSVALKFDLHNNAGEGVNSVGLFVNGAAPTVPANDLTSSGVSLHSGDVMQAHVVYDGTTLRLTLTDTATQASSTTSYPVNIPGIVGTDSAYVGFTAGTGAASATEDILSWEFVNDMGAASETPAPTIYLVPGSSPAMVAIADAVPGAAIYYTTDDTMPTTASQRYSSPFALPAFDTVQAIAVPGTGSPSAVATQYTYNLFPPSQFAYGSNSITAENLRTQAINYYPQGAISVIDGRILLTDLHQAEATSIWYTQPVSMGSFTTEFTFQLLQATADGFTFTLQDVAPNPLGKDGAGLGYQGIPRSVAVKFDLHNNAGEGANSVGLYLNGAAPTVPANDLTPSGINLHSGDVMKARLTYDGKMLTLALTDSATKATASFPYAVDIPGIVGRSFGYIGFTASTGAASAIQQILSWSYGP